MRSALGVGTVVPCESTIHRSLQRVDGDELNATIGAWAGERATNRAVIHLDSRPSPTRACPAGFALAGPESGNGTNAYGFTKQSAVSACCAARRVSGRDCRSRCSGPPIDRRRPPRPDSDARRAREAHSTDAASAARTSGAARLPATAPRVTSSPRGQASSQP